MIKASLAQAPVMMLAYPIDTIKTRLQIPFGAASSSSTQLCNTEQTPRQLTPFPDMHLANTPLYSMHLRNAPSTFTPLRQHPFPPLFLHKITQRTEPQWRTSWDAQRQDLICDASPASSYIRGVVPP